MLAHAPVRVCVCARGVWSVSYGCSLVHYKKKLTVICHLWDENSDLSDNCLDIISWLSFILISKDIFGQKKVANFYNKKFNLQVSFLHIFTGIFFVFSFYIEVDHLHTKKCFIRILDFEFFTTAWKIK